MCDANRVIILQWPGFVTFNGIDVRCHGMVTWHTSDHHGLSHRNGSDGGGRHLRRRASSRTSTRSTPGTRAVLEAGRPDRQHRRERSRPMLDNSMVMWLPELADGNAHNNNNLPIVIAGSAGGYLKQGASVNLDTKTLGTGNSEASCVSRQHVGRVQHRLQHRQRAAQQAARHAAQRARREGQRGRRRGRRAARLQSPSSA